MKWIGQQIYDQVSRFRNDVYLESISSGTIASGGHLGLDSNNKIVKAVDGGGDITSVVAGTNLSGGATSGAATINLADASTSAKGAASFSSANFAASSGAITIKDGGVDLTAEVTGVLPSANMDGDTAHLTTAQTFTGVKTFGTTTKLQFRDANAYINSPDANDLEIAATDITLDAAGQIYFEADTARFVSGQANDPLVIIQGEADDDTGPRLRFNKKRGADGEDGDSCGLLQWQSYDDGTPSSQIYGQIETKIHDATAGEESGKMELGVANEDGGMGTGLILQGGSVDNEVDVTIGLGASSTTKVSGVLHMGSTLTITNAGLLRVPNQSNITGVGTISSGVWQGTTIKTAYIGDDQVTEDKLANTLLAEIDANTAKVTRHTLIDSDVMTGASSSNVASAESIKAYVDSKYATSYMAFLCDTDAFVNNQYITVSGNGISNHAWNVDTDLDHTDTNARTINHADAHISTNGLLLTASILIPQACQLMGFYAVGRNEVTDTAFGFGIFVTAEANANWGSASNNATGGNTILRAYGISANDDNEKKHQKIDGMLDTPFDLGEGDLITPAAWGPTGDQVKGTITLVLRTLIQ